MSLVFPAIAAIVALLLLRGSATAWRGIVGFIAAVLALPTLPAVGLPVAGGSTRWVLAASSSLVLWLALGYVASRRATRRMAASWPEWRHEWTRLAAGIWIGSLIGLALAGAYLLVLA